MKKYIIEAMRKGAKAARQNIVPGIILQLVALALIISYYNIPAVSTALDRVGEVNIKWSPWFAVVVTMFFGGVIPLSIEALTAKKQGRDQKNAMQIAFTLLVWGVNGFLTDRFYVFQAHVFGNEVEFFTVAKKVIVDQFIWVPIYVVPVFTLTFLWRDSLFSLTRMKERLVQKGFVERGAPMMISNWSVWIPAVSVIYAFPLALQLILMNLILVFWSLMLTFFVTDE